MGEREVFARRLLVGRGLSAAARRARDARRLADVDMAWGGRKASLVGMKVFRRLVAFSIWGIALVGLVYS